MDENMKKKCLGLYAYGAVPYDIDNILAFITEPRVDLATQKNVNKKSSQIAINALR
jgi:hypothetical protein